MNRFGRDRVKAQAVSFSWFDGNGDERYLLGCRKVARMARFCLVGVGGSSLNLCTVITTPLPLENK